MSVASRIQEIETHIGDIYDTLEVGGTDLTDLNKNIVNINSSLKDRYKYFLNNGVEIIWNNWEKVIGEGTEFTLENTIQAPMKVNLKGNTYQKSTTGKNLFDISKVLTNSTKLVNNGETLTINTPSNDSSVWGSTPNTLQDYCPSLQVGDNVYITANTTGTDKYIYLDTSAYLWRYGTQRTITQNDLNSRVRFYASGASTTATISEIMVSTTGGDYEPYTNGASPNPEFPQDIQVVSGENTIMIANEDSSESQNYTIDLGDIELCKIGDYQDRIYKDSGKWYLEKKIGKVVLDGSESWSDFSVGDTNFRCQYDVALPNILTPPTNPAQLFSNYFKAINRDNAYAKTEIGIAQYGSALGKVFICAPNTILSEKTLASWKTWLGTHNTEVYYVLATPTYTEITDTTLLSQLEAIKYSYDTQTNISQDNDDLPFILDVAALKNI